MDYKIKVKALREIMPIPMAEAVELLKENNGDIKTCAEIFKAKSIELICKETGCSENMAIEFYEKEKFDLNRTISFIKEELFDQNYKPLNNITLENLITDSERPLDLLTTAWILAINSPLLNGLVR